MTRYYYDDPIAALWMTKRHGIKLEFDGDRVDIKDGYFQTSLSDDDWPDWLSGRRSSPWRVVEKAYIHPDSEALLAPQVGDVLYREPEGYALADIRIVSDTAEDVQPINLKFIERGYRIIQRNGLAFIFPKAEA